MAGAGEQMRRSTVADAVQSSITGAELQHLADQGARLSGAHEARRVRVAVKAGRMTAPARTLVRHAATGRFVPAIPAVPPRLARALSAQAHANPFLQAASGAIAASTAYTIARDHGASRSQAAGAGVVAASPMAAALALPTALGKYAPALAGGLSKLALPLAAASALVGAARGGYRAYKQGSGVGGIAAGAALGVADTLTAGLASQAAARIDRLIHDHAGAPKAGAYLSPKAERRDVASRTVPVTAPRATANAAAPAARQSYATVRGASVDGTDKQIAKWNAQRKTG